MNRESIVLGTWLVFSWKWCNLAFLAHTIVVCLRTRKGEKPRGRLRRSLQRTPSSRAGGRQNSDQLFCCSNDGIVTVLSFISPHALRFLMVPGQINEYISGACVPKEKSTWAQPVPHRAGGHSSCPSTSAGSHSKQFWTAEGLQSWDQSWDTNKLPLPPYCSVSLMNFPPLTQEGD